MKKIICRNCGNDTFFPDNDGNDLCMKCWEKYDYTKPTSEEIKEEMNKPKLNQPDVETTITTAILGDSLNLNVTIPTKQFKDVFVTGMGVEEYKPTLEEVKKEWEDLGYKFKERTNYIIFVDEIDKISFAFFYKKDGQDDVNCYEVENHSEEPLIIDIKLHQLLTKTFRALGWEV